MSRTRRLVGWVVATALITGLMPLLALPAAAVSEPEVLATGLNGPYKPTVRDDGSVYVAEAGTGGDECHSVVGPEGEETEACYGATGSVTRIAGGQQTRVVTGLPSVRSGNELLGPSAVGFDQSGLMHVLVGMGGDAETRETLGDDRFATLLRVPEVGVTTVLADLLEFEIENDPDGDQPGSDGVDTNPFGLTFDGNDALVADAGGNDLLRVAPDGTIEVEAIFEARMVEAPPFMTLPPPGLIPMQAVPTAVELDPEGVIHVSQLTGFPFPMGGANIYSVVNGTETPVETGFTNVVDFAIADDGTMYVLEFAAEGLLAGPPNPRLVQVRTDGTRKTLLYGSQLPVPGGVAVDSEGMVYLSVCTLCGPGEGMLWRIDPTVAFDSATEAACPPVDVPGATFTDIAPSTHREAIECAAWWGVVTGFSAQTFGPEQTITRAQVASMVARALREAGAELADDAPNAFTDDDASFHHGDINALAAVGVILGRGDGLFDPTAPVSRAEVTSLLARAYTVAAEAELAAGPDAFTDDEGSVHEDDIDAVAAIGWVRGRGGGIFDPTGNATRAEFSTMVMRMLSTLVDEELATLPTA